ncbi:receptor-activated Ca2+-permeable cation channel [Ephemerocybe angulata]|uniref:Receptor-activated Ca2+-permeable cation channel n=1 Tax=Ephemerocybe angulata TaxID=980116 RepID=A0A8H6M614_9AGAR|nr:receptor-activated Ca2+-permeable cation channel [Tulosesus angulatus]
MDPEQRAGLLAPSPEDLAQVKVFPLIPALRKDVTKTIDSALTWEQLTAADINWAIVRPIVNKYASLRNMAVIYACLVVRQYFLAESETELAFAGVMLARADFCEILAIKLLNRFGTNYIQLIAVLTTAWSPLAGAPQHVLDTVKQTMNADDDDDIDTAHSAIEMAIQTEAKDLLAAPIAQKVVNDIYAGKVVFSAVANRSILADNYKPRAIEIYNAKQSPFLDHYRLRVPKYGAYLEFINFALLLLTLVLSLSNQDKAHLTNWEIAFMVFAAAFMFEEYTAATEHGWIIYIANIWNAFDFSLIVIFFAYFGLRIKGLSAGDLDMSAMAFDVLSCAACILFPRLAFFAVSDNVVVLSLRAMIAQFVFFIGIAAICFSGLLFTLWTLAGDSTNHEGHAWTFKSIAWLMVQIWFGNTYLSFAQATSFHPVFGPILMTVFAALSNTLLLTILISILSNTVARIDANATQEYLYQFTISTIEGVKSDALFSYQPPFNILAFLILKPSSWFLSPRSLHSLNVFLIKLTSLPQLIVIGIYERYLADGRKFRESSIDVAQALFSKLPRHIKNMPLVEALVGSTSNDLFEAIFDVDVELTSEYDLFLGYDDDERVGLRSHTSRETLGGGAAATSVKDEEIGAKKTPKRRPRKLSPSPSPLGKARERGRAQSPAGSMKMSLNEPSPVEGTGPSFNVPQTPRGSNPATPAERGQKQKLRVQSLLSPMDAVMSPEALTSTSSSRSPLARLFTQKMFPNEQQVAVAAQAEAGVRRIEALLEDVKELPVQRLKEEMKELQDRQARIENLLLMLTRGMRNETPHRQGTT